MRLLRHPALLSAIVMVLMGLGLNRLLQGLVVPRMLERGNVLMVRAVVPPLENYFAAFQEWPTGTAQETMWRLQGAKNDIIGEKEQTAGPAPAVTEPGTAAEPGKPAPLDAPVVRRQRLPPAPNFLDDAPVRAAGLTIGDAWGRPLEFSFTPAGPATVTSLGADGVLGTPDDVAATAHIVPRRTQPTRAIFLADRAFRRAEEARRTQRKLAESAK